MNIVGFGKIGCGIVDKLSSWPQYKTFYINTEMVGKNCYILPKFKTAEEAEKKAPKFPQLVEDITEEIFFFCNGHEICGGAILATLEQFKHLKINVIYIRPDFNLLGDEEKSRDRVVFNILQQYARSALFEKIVLRKLIHILPILFICSIILKTANLSWAMPAPQVKLTGSLPLGFTAWIVMRKDIFSICIQLVKNIFILLLTKKL